MLAAVYRIRLLLLFGYVPAILSASIPTFKSTLPEELSTYSNSNALAEDNTAGTRKARNNNGHGTLSSITFKKLFNHRTPRSVNAAGSSLPGAGKTRYNANVEMMKEYSGKHISDKTVENYMKNFLVDMLKLFHYELQEVANESQKHSENNHRRHKRVRKTRPKRNIRSILRDSEVRRIIMQYLHQKGNDPHGDPLLRYG